MDRLRTIFTNFVAMIPYWIFVMICYYVIRFFGIEQTPGIAVQEPLYQTFITNFILIRMGIVAALIYTLIETFGGHSFFKKRPIGVTLLMKMAMTFILILLVSFLVITFFRPAEVGGPDFGNILYFKPFWSLLIYFFMTSMIASFIQLMVAQFGRSQFLRIVTGQYRQPRQEKRIFLFIDLKSSVTYAEKLGHLRYSQLIQQCFFHLDASVAKYGGEIYQYVGDEAVVSWPYQEGIINNACLSCFLDFVDRIEENRSDYMEKFHCVPEFKAGLHGGFLTAAEVGVAKKEIAYHGDVINTASRIQESCNQLGEKLLISFDLAEDLAQTNLRSLGPISLKGRRQPIELLTMT